MSSKNDRLIALNALIEVIDKQQSLSHLKTELTPFAQALCFGVARQYFKLGAIAKYLLKKPIKKNKVELVLFMGLYQLCDSDQPEYAVLNETVALLNQRDTLWAKSLVNAVLRRYCRERDKIHQALSEDPNFCYNTPNWLLKRLQKSWPKHWETIAKAHSAHPPMSLRINTNKTSRDAYITRLSHQNITALPLAHTPSGLVLEHPMPVSELPGFESGDVSVQDAAAQLAPTLLELKPELTLLDACSAPGGKLCHILETMPHLKTCTAIDIEPKRIARIKENLNRLNLNATVITGDAKHPDTWWNGQLFDRILLDAPCSATGVIRRHPDIQLLRTPRAIEAIQKTQAELLASLWPLLAPGGLLLYATCSILPEENEQQVAAFVKRHADCTASTDKQAFGHATGHGWQILPGEHQMDGFFYSALYKKT